MSQHPESTPYHLLACALVNDSAVIDREISTLARFADAGAELRLWLLADEPVLKRREIEELTELYCPGCDVLLVIHDAEADDNELQAALACLENVEILVIDDGDSFGKRLADELKDRCEVVRV
jgi:hypothetical protein